MREHQTSSDTTIELIRTDQKDASSSDSQDLVSKQYDSWMSSTSSTPWMSFLLGSFQYHSLARLHRGNLKQEFDARYSLPGWISQTALHVQGQNCLSTWQINYRAYRIMSLLCPLFTAIAYGDIPTVQKMLAYKTAFVTDRSEYDGEGVLHVSWSILVCNTRNYISNYGQIAIRHCDPEMCRLLLSG